MPSTTKMLALAASLSQASAVFTGFNYGSTFTSGAIKQQSDYEAEFKAAQSLPGTNGAFNSARLYTMVQGDTPNDAIAAIPAAIATKTNLLLGLWASGGDAAFANEIAALQNSIQTYCSQGYGDLVSGISVGSEDLYRNSPIGIAAGSDVGANPDTLVSYIKQVRSAISGTCLSKASIGHVDTWTAFVNGSNDAVIEAIDWLGMDAYPYFESTKPNSIGQGLNLFNEALGNTKGASMNKPVWVTETGWPVSGKTSGAGVPSTENAKTYWDAVGCPNFGEINMFWYTLQDAAPSTPNPSFGILTSLSGQPLYDLSCKGVETSTNSTSSSSTMTSTSGSASGSASSSSSTMGSGSGSGSSNSMTSVVTTMSTASPSGGSGSGSGSGTGSGSGSPTGSSSGAGGSASAVPTHTAGGAQLNSMSAVAVALLLAVAVL